MKRTSDFSKRIKEYREKNNLTLADMEKITGIPAQTINRYELGKRTPKVDMASKIAEALQVDSLWLQGYDIEIEQNQKEVYKIIQNYMDEKNLKIDTLQRILNLISKKFDTDASFEVEMKLKPKTVYEWKRGKSKSYMNNLPTIADYFGVSTDYLLGREESPKEDEDTYLVVGFGQTGGPKKVRSPKETAIVALNEVVKDLSVEEVEEVTRFARYTKDNKRKE